MRRNCVLLIALVLAAISAWAQPEEACGGTRISSEGLSLKVTVGDNRVSFREGEIIPLVLAFSSSKPGEYEISTRNYDRSGRLQEEDFCVDPARGRDPVADYFAFGTFMAGGLTGGPAKLSSQPYVVSIDLNEFVALPPGLYTLQLNSHRVSGTRLEMREGNAVQALANVWSDPFQLEITPATPEWQAQKLRHATSVLDDASTSEDSKKQAARTLRFLASEAAVRELARRYADADENDPKALDYMFGLFSSSHRQLAISTLESALTDPARPITYSFVQTMVKLEMESDPKYKVSPALETEQQALVDAKFRAYEVRTNEILARLASNVARKNPAARTKSALTLLMLTKRLPATARQQLQQIILQGWNLLPGETRNEILDSRWSVVGGPEFLGILRAIAAGQPKVSRTLDEPDRAVALARILELEPEEGRRLLRAEALAGHEDVPIELLSRLPQKSDREITRVALSRLQKSQTTLDLGLVDRFGSTDDLPAVKKLYEDSARSWTCGPPPPLLRYLARTDPQYAVQKISAAASASASSGCNRALFSDLGPMLAHPRIEAIAIAALDASDPDLSRDAAEGLRMNGSAKAEPALWRRLERLHEMYKDNPNALVVLPNMTSESDTVRQSALESSLVGAIARGQSWFTDPDGLRRLKTITSNGQQGTVDSMLFQLQTQP
ncbi:MAG TPA: hypothetical protein VGC88_07005, partial [Terriglobales bacterium]